MMIEFPKQFLLSWIRKLDSERSYVAIICLTGSYTRLMLSVNQSLTIVWLGGYSGHRPSDSFFLFGQLRRAYAQFLRAPHTVY